MFTDMQVHVLQESTKHTGKMWNRCPCCKERHMPDAKCVPGR